MTGSGSLERESIVWLVADAIRERLEAGTWSVDMTPVLRFAGYDLAEALTDSDLHVDVVVGQYLATTLHRSRVAHEVDCRIGIRQKVADDSGAPDEIEMRSLAKLFEEILEWLAGLDSLTIGRTDCERATLIEVGPTSTYSYGACTQRGQWESVITLKFTAEVDL